ncbi:hypothetical protein M422DRAFT_246975 [Sphaerobolus stellatus SS14]|nr:hypothetical protein M422DRAFT_246975 [Sphaerobolus stellatus SS14]
MSTHVELQALPALGWVSLFVKTWRKNVYPAIAVDGALAGSEKGLRVLVTGGGKGLGRTIALTFAQAGDTKVVIAGRSLAGLEETKKLIEVKGGNQVECCKNPFYQISSEAPKVTDQVESGQAGVRSGSIWFDQVAANIFKTNRKYIKVIIWL